jgi:hypothetical protein
VIALIVLFVWASRDLFAVSPLGDGMKVWGVLIFLPEGHGDLLLAGYD